MAYNTNQGLFLIGAGILLLLTPPLHSAEQSHTRVKRQFSGGDACLQIYSVPKQTVQCEPTDEVVDEFQSIRSVLDDHKSIMDDLGAKIDILDPSKPREIPAEIKEKLVTIEEVKINQSAHGEILKRLEGEIDRLLERIVMIEAEERAEVAKLISLQTDLIGSVLERANISVHESYIDKLAENSLHLTEKLRELEDNIRAKIEDTRTALDTELNQAEEHSRVLVQSLEQRLLESANLLKEQLAQEQEERARHQNETDRNAEQISELKQTITALQEHVNQNMAADTRMTAEVTSCMAEVQKLRQEMEAMAEEMKKKEHLVPRLLKAQDCQEALVYYQPVSGVYTIYPTPVTTPFDVYCDMQDDQGWTVILRRQDGSVEFFRGWDDYRDGFGDMASEYWMGLERIHYMTSHAGYKLRVDVQDWEDKWYYAEYDSFSVANEEEDYTLNVSGYHGDAGDSLVYHNGMPFSTMDRNHDVNNGICATWCHGAWWYKDCFHSNLNGRYYTEGPYVTKTGWGDGVVWRTLKTSNFYSLKSAVMKIMPHKKSTSEDLNDAQ